MYNVEIQPILDTLAGMYRSLPAVDCSGCGRCCVSPTCTLIEFVPLIKGITDNKCIDLSSVFNRPLREHTGFEGNTICMFQRDSRCDVHLFRTGACRLFGVPVVERMEVPEMVRCFNPKRDGQENFSAENLRSWLRNLVQLNRKLYPMGEEPYCLTGLTIECWIDLWLGDTWYQPFFRHLHSILREFCQVPAGVELPWSTRTRMEEKIDLIDSFFSIIDGGDAPEMMRILRSVRDDFPLTGNWFHDEANRFIEEIGRHLPAEETA